MIIRYIKTKLHSQSVLKYSQSAINLFPVQVYGMRGSSLRPPENKLKGYRFIVHFRAVNAKKIHIHLWKKHLSLSETNCF